jgi:hypothetical protein
LGYTTLGTKKTYGVASITFSLTCRTQKELNCKFLELKYNRARAIAEAVLNN